MTRKRWKPVQPYSMQHAIRLCLDYARHKHNRSIQQVADLVGTTEWTIYKWMNEGSIPSKRIRPLEFACSATFITHYIAISAQKLVIDIPSGRSSCKDDVLDLQNHVNSAVLLLTQFYRGDIEAADVLQGVTHAMQQLAGHRENVRKHKAPELSLFEGESA